MRRVAGVFPLSLRLRHRRWPRNRKSSRKIHGSTWAAALALVLFCVGAALIVAGLLQTQEQSAGVRALPRTAHLPLQGNEIPNRDKKAAREPVHAAARLMPQPAQPQPELANATLPEIAPQDAPPPEALAPQGAPEGDDTIEENGSAQTGSAETGSAETGRASWYDLTTKTASGETMDGTLLTAAHNTLPLGSHVRVKNLANGRAVVVRINDRGPFAKDRIIDLSKAAAEQLGMIADGVAKVRVSLVAPALAAEAKR
jgi:peptidoglycan lytic transglycosylase